MSPSSVSRARGARSAASRSVPFGARVERRRFSRPPLSAPPFARTHEIRTQSPGGPFKLSINDDDGARLKTRATGSLVARRCTPLRRLGTRGRRPNAALGPLASRLKPSISSAAFARAGERGDNNASPPPRSPPPRRPPRSPPPPPRRPPRARSPVVAVLLCRPQGQGQEDGPTARRPGSRAARPPRAAPTTTAVTYPTPTSRSRRACRNPCRRRRRFSRRRRRRRRRRSSSSSRLPLSAPALAPSRSPSWATPCGRST